MKKLLLLTCAIIFIPYIITSIFFREDEIKFIYKSNMQVRVKNVETNEITNIPFEDYIVGVLAGEMPVSFEMEALKAQAVAARSYVMKQMVYNRDKEYDVVNTVKNQVYLDDDYLKKTWKEDYTTKINKLKMAVLETYNEYLEYDGEVVEAMFFSTSVGKTENSEEVFSSKKPYLRSVDSSWDSISPVFEVKYTFNLNEFYEKLNIKYNDILKLETIEQTSTGRIKKIKINNILFEGSTVVNNLNLKSNHFAIEQKDKTINITTKGYGHGVGMSQYGAQAMALEGYNYKEILSHYYGGTNIKKI
ncbi:MAG: stage II sporulation protein D [Firmicutes bacterium]|nr:stage II sporulation protein D [Bacillota bacterium]